MRNLRKKINSFLDLYFFHKPNRENKKAFDLVEGFFLEIYGKKEQVYQFKNPLTMSTGRYLVYLDYVFEMAENADKSFLVDSLKAVQNALNKGEIGTASGQIFLLLDAIENLNPISHFYKIASVFFVLENENENTYDYSLNDAKIEAFKKLKGEMKVFFYTLLSTNLEKYRVNLPPDTLQFFQQAETDEAKLNAYRKIILDKVD